MLKNVSFQCGAHVNTALALNMARDAVVTCRHLAKLGWIQRS